MNFVEGKYVAFFPAAKAILQVAGYLTGIHGMGHLVHLIIESLNLKWIVFGRIHTRYK